MPSSRELRDRYDAEMRRDPPTGPGLRVERQGPLVRLVGEEIQIVYSDLTEGAAAAIVAQEAASLRASPHGGEWKVFGHDRPSDLESLLAAAGFEPGPPETLLVYDLHQGPIDGPVPPGVRLRRVEDEAGAEDAARASERAFGVSIGRSAARYRAWVGDPTAAMLVAYVHRAPVASARLELPPGRSFAGLWGGGTDPAHRRRGIYRALVAARASIAADSGYRYLTADARESSAPLLHRLGFVPLSTTRPWTMTGRGSDSAAPAGP